MFFRYARHSSNINALCAFYTEVLGLRLLGRFENHDGYDGVFIGEPGQSWHLEFTQSDSPSTARFDEDDALVFYPPNRAAYTQIKTMLKDRPQLHPKNPYWQKNGLCVQDPDGFYVIVSDLKCTD